MQRWLAALLVGLIAIAGTGYWGYQQSIAKARAEIALENNYNRAFFNTMDYIQNLEVLLAKSLVAGGDKLDDRLFTEIWQQTSAALDNITQLPVNDVVVGRTAKFLTQMGDFTRSLSENKVEGTALSDEQLDILKNLYRQSGELNSELQNIEADVLEGRISFREMIGQVRKGLADEGRQLASANFRVIDEKMHGYPTLIYDGPFSDHLENREPKAAQGEKISEKEARAKALEYMDGNRDYVAQVMGTVEGNIPCYRVELRPRERGQAIGQLATMDISRQGGKVVWTIVSRRVDETSWNLDRARQKAQQFLKERGYENMVVTYYQKHDNVVTYNFVAQQDNVIIYPDMIKVSLALDNGEVVGVDSRGYLMSHHRRDIPQPKLSEQEARSKVGRGLSLEGEGRLAIIPLETYEERLTWEFKGTMEDNTFLIYINALTGEQERILQLMSNDKGTLTM